MGESQTIRAVRGNLAGQGLREPLFCYYYLNIGMGCTAVTVPAER